MEPSFTVCVCVCDDMTHLRIWKKRKKTVNEWLYWWWWWENGLSISTISTISTIHSLAFPPFRIRHSLLVYFYQETNGPKHWRCCQLEIRKKTKNIHSFIQLESYEEKKTTTKTILWFIWDFHFKSPHFLTMMIIIIIMKMQYKMEDDE